MPTLVQELSRHRTDLHDANRLAFDPDWAIDEAQFSADQLLGITRGYTTTGSRRVAVRVRSIMKKGSAQQSADDVRNEAMQILHAQSVGGPTLLWFDTMRKAIVTTDSGRYTVADLLQLNPHMAIVEMTAYKVLELAERVSCIGIHHHHLIFDKFAVDAWNEHDMRLMATGVKSVNVKLVDFSAGKLLQRAHSTEHMAPFVRTDEERFVRPPGDGEPHGGGDLYDPFAAACVGLAIVGGGNGLIDGVHFHRYALGISMKEALHGRADVSAGALDMIRVLTSECPALRFKANQPLDNHHFMKLQLARLRGDPDPEPVYPGLETMWTANQLHLVYGARRGYACDFMLEAAARLNVGQPGVVIGHEGGQPGAAAEEVAVEGQGAVAAEAEEGSHSTSRRDSDMSLETLPSNAAPLPNLPNLSESSEVSYPTGSSTTASLSNPSSTPVDGPGGGASSPHTPDASTSGGVSRGGAMSGGSGAQSDQLMVMADLPSLNGFSMDVGPPLDTSVSLAGARFDEDVAPPAAADRSFTGNDEAGGASAAGAGPTDARNYPRLRSGEGTRRARNDENSSVVAQAAGAAAFNERGGAGADNARRKRGRDEMNGESAVEDEGRDSVAAASAVVAGALGESAQSEVGFSDWFDGGRTVNRRRLNDGSVVAGSGGGGGAGVDGRTANEDDVEMWDGLVDDPDTNNEEAMWVVSGSRWGNAGDGADGASSIGSSCR